MCQPCDCQRVASTHLRCTGFTEVILRGRQFPRFHPNKWDAHLFRTDAPRCTGAASIDGSSFPLPPHGAFDVGGRYSPNSPTRRRTSRAMDLPPLLGQSADRSPLSLLAGGGGLSKVAIRHAVLGRTALARTATLGKGFMLGSHAATSFLRGVRGTKSDALTWKGATGAPTHAAAASSPV